MARPERLMACRALPTQPVRPNRILKLMSIDDRERPTDPVSHAPPSAAAHELLIPPNGALPEPQPNPNSYSDFVLSELLANSRQLKSDSAAFAENRNELAGLFEAQTASIERAITANYGLVKSEVVALRTEHETFRAELESLKSQLAALEAVRDKVAELELKLAQREVAPSAAGTAT